MLCLRAATTFILLCLTIALVAGAAPAPPLAGDNLIANPWFRAAADPTDAGLDGWTDPQNLWGTSQKPSNPSPDGVNGTAARLANGSGNGQDHGGQDGYLSTVVTANPALRTLRFQTWAVTLFLEQATVTVAGANGPQGPWTNLWQPWSSQASGDGVWFQTPLAQVEIATGYPYYRIELHGRYQAGRNQGVKYTGVYFSVSGDTTPPDPLAAPSDFQATALSPSEIELTWNAQAIEENGFELERSDAPGAPFANIANLVYGVERFVDSGLAEDTEYRYRLRAVGPGGPSPWAGPVTATTPPVGGGGGTVQVYGPTADAYVNAQRATANYGTDSVLRVRTNQLVSFVAFEVDPGTIESAVLRLTANATTTATVQVAATEPLNVAWAETGITWNNQPAAGAVLGSLPPTPPGQTVELDVTAAVAEAALADGRLSLVLLGSGAGQSYFLSREATLDPPELVVTYQGGVEPPPPPPAIDPLPHLEVGPSPALLLEVGDTVQLEAAWMDADGNPAPLPPGAQLVWMSSNPERVSVDANGMATVLGDDSYTVIMVAAEGAGLHVPGAASIATGAILNPAVLDFDPALLLDIAVDPDPNAGTGYLSLSVERTPATEALGTGNVVTFGTAASISVESVEILADRLVLHGTAPPFDAVYEHLTIDLDSVALERVADVYAEAGFGSWDGSPVTTGASSQLPAAAKALSDCQFSINPSFSPSSQFKLLINDGKLIAMSILFEGLLGMAVPEVRWQTQVECSFEILPRIWLFPVPLYGVATFHFYEYLKPGVEISLDFGQTTGAGELGSPVFEYSTRLFGGLDWDEVDGLDIPGGYDDPEVTGSAAKPYLDGLETADMDLSARSFIEIGVKASLYPGVFPADPTGALDSFVVLDFFLLATQLAAESHAVLPAEAFLGPADPAYAGPTFTDSLLWDFFFFKGIETGGLTERVLEIFGWEDLGGAAFETEPINIARLSYNSTEPQLAISEDPVWIDGVVPYWPSTVLKSERPENWFQQWWRPTLYSQIWGRRATDPEFALLWTGDTASFSPIPGDEGEWEFRSLDYLLPLIPMASAIETVTVKKAPPVLMIPVDPELVVTLGAVGVLDAQAFNVSSEPHTYSLSNDGGPSWLSVLPEGEISIAAKAQVSHQITVDCTAEESIPASWIELTLSVTGDDTVYTYPIFAGCENFSVEPDVVTIKGSVVEPPILLEGELTIHNRTGGELLWSYAPVEGLAFSVDPPASFIPAGGDQVVTLSIACTVGGITEYPFEIFAGPDRRPVTLRLECSDTGGNSWGDPHLVTHDGVKYDFQAHGEMVLSRASADGFEVQVRQAPGSSGRVSYNKAAAMRVGSDRVAFYVNPPGGGGLVMVDGEAVTIADAAVYALPGGGAILRDGSKYTVTWPASGSYVRVKLAGSYLDVRVHADGALAGTLEGLLGNYDGDGANDFKLRDGTPLPAPPSFTQKYDCSQTRCLAYDDPAGWLIRDAAESLFDYDVGLGPLDYAPQNGAMYPLVETSLDDFDPALVAWAQSQCVAAGITDPILLDACILDIVVSGDVEMGLGAGEIESGTAPEPGIEICDGFDNDLNGAIDDGGVCLCQDAITGGRAYRFCGTTVQWAVARTACLAQGLDLAKIQDETENQAVSAWIRANGFQARWIGLTDEGQEGTWIWADGTPVGYTNWGIGQPSGGTSENCVEHAEHLTLGDSWNDLSCTTVRGFICE